MPRKAQLESTTGVTLLPPVRIAVTSASKLKRDVRNGSASDASLFGEQFPEARPPRTLGTTNTQDDGIFGWFKYVQDFPGDFAKSWLGRLASPKDVVWEPFCGSGTTLVACKLLGIESIGFDVNPFMVDVTKTKLDWSLDPKRIRALAERLVEGAESKSGHEPVAPIKVRWAEYEAASKSHSTRYPGNDEKLERWIAPAVLLRFQSLLEGIARIEDERYRRFLRLAVAQLLIPASNMTFRPNICYEARATIDYPVIAAFRTRLAQMLADYQRVAGLPGAVADVRLGDARSEGPERADVIFTSPPYPNDMEYVHQTRLELALLEYVSSKRHLTALKKQMISSSVKLVYRDNEWQKHKGMEIEGIKELYDQLAETLRGRNWGWNAADMVAQFFGGMRTVTANWFQRLRPGGVAAVVIGDSAFNGVKVNSDTLFAQTAIAEGFELTEIAPFRERWNPKHTIELRESVVLLRKPSRTKRTIASSRVKGAKK